MTPITDEPEYLSRGIDYLGDLGAKLRDLQGFATLAHELIQNADDAAGATRMSFAVSQSALVVDNDGQFTDCGHVTQPECPWKHDATRGYMCDFHGFRSVASGHKRERLGTTGAFGIGFISVYQITDLPELISGGRHWKLHEDLPEDKRIRVCKGCRACQAPNLPKTRFILPWALDPNSTLRKALRAPAQSPDAPKELLGELCRSLATAMLFLKNLTGMEVFDDGKVVLCLQRLVENDSLIVSDGKKDRIWHLLRGEFKETADQLRQRPDSRIEPKRTANVTLAIPEDSFDKGLLCACLPTQQETGLPFHVNADFFPHSDRKRIILEQDYQSEWNRAAIRSAAGILCDHLHGLPAKLGHKHLWHLFSTVQRVGDDAQKGHKEKTFEQFWERLRPILRGSKVFFTSRKEWKTAGEVVFPSEKEEEDVVPILEGLDLSLLHAELRPHFNLFRSKDVGVALLDINHIADALLDNGLDERTEVSLLPSFLQPEESRRLLRRELALLLGRQRRPDDQKKLARCAVMPGRDKALWPCNQIYRADEETISLFTRINRTTPFLADIEEEAAELARLCPEFTTAVAVERLAKTLFDSDSETAAPLDPVAILGWFEDRRDDLRRSVTVRNGIAALPIFPCSEGFKPLTSLSLPGDFTDPIGLAGVVDLARLKERRDFLIELGAKKLTFTRYAGDHVPRALRQPDITVDQKRSVVRLLAERIGEIRDHDEVRQSLAELQLIECKGGHFRRPREVYFDHDVIRVVLGGEVALAVLPKGHESATQDLYHWLGVAASPRYEAIVGRVKALTTNPPTDDSVDAIEVIFRHLGQRFGDREKSNPVLMELRTLAWLPARDDRKRWHRPGELYAVFQDYLFESQAEFLDLPREVQTSCGDLLSFLMVKNRPSTRQVVDHLIHCSQSGVVVNKEVYRVLNDAATDEAVLRLRDKACLILRDNSYVKPSQVFWNEHPFGHYRHRLGNDLRKYGDLFARLDVRESPDHNDAFAVLHEISNEFGPPNHLLNESTHAILLACWQRLDRALQEEVTAPVDLAKLEAEKVIPDARRLLNPPMKMFFEDRPGLSMKFKPFLDNDVIPRPQGAWRAMLEAGVRLLSSAVCTHLVECRDPVADPRVTALLRERRRQLLRVLETAHDANGQPDLSLLDRVQVQSVSALRVQYSVKAFNQEHSSEPEDLPAKYQASDGLLYFVPRGSDAPWASIARELALALWPEADPGRLAAGIKEVLAATSEGEAAAMLDELGFAPLAVAEQELGVAAEVIEDLGGESAPPETQQPRRPTEGKAPVTDGLPGEDGKTQSAEGSSPTGQGAPNVPVTATKGQPETQRPGPGVDKSARSPSDGDDADDNADFDDDEQEQGTGQRRDGERRRTLGTPARSPSDEDDVGDDDNSDDGEREPGTGQRRHGGRHGPLGTPARSPSDEDDADEEGDTEDERKPGTGQRRDGQRRGQRPAGGRDGKRGPARGGYPVLRSYVSYDDPEAEREVDPVVAERRERVNRQGMNRVLEYERQHGRRPREMPHLHPGYDVESDNDQGQLERYIEVKSLSGNWEGPHAGMTDMQFKNNLAIGKRYWLYVVERADKPDFTIWRIQNPAESVTSFMFDDGWKNVAESDEEAGDPVAGGDMKS